MHVNKLKINYLRAILHSVRHGCEEMSAVKQTLQKVYTNYEYLFQLSYYIRYWHKRGI